jgi:hypothetical protein
MPPPLIERLQKLPRGEWHGLPRASEEAIAAVEAFVGLPLPDDYRSLLGLSDGGALYRHRTKLELESTDNLIPWNKEERFVESLPGMFVIGDDASDCVFYYDPRNRLERGAWALFEVELGVLAPDSGFPMSKYVGRDLGELVDAILANEPLFDRPYLGPPP